MENSGAGLARPVNDDETLLPRSAFHEEELALGNSSGHLHSGRQALC